MGEFVPSGESITVVINGREWSIRELKSKERNKILEESVQFDTFTKKATIDTTAMGDKLLAISVVKVPPELDAEFLKGIGRPWKGTAEDFGELRGAVYDKLLAEAEKLNKLEEDTKNG